ncbi:MAG TPA: FAD-dependent monooxygenase [Myxococcota bacterium]|nr:FAD-dependent monooxygenase [Myxococcota bacterium]
MKEQSQPRVLIVGAGPSGLMMAHELARFGVPFMIIERDLKKSSYSRAIGVQIRTLEIFHALSLYSHLAELAENIGSIEIFTDGRGRITIDLPKTTSFFAAFLTVDQTHTEAVLENALIGRGQSVMRGVELLSLKEVEEGVKAELLDQQGKITSQQFSCVVGADGAHSTVRKSMSNQFSGGSYDDAFILADAFCANFSGRHAIHTFFKDTQFFAMIPMHGEHHYRLISIRRGETTKAGPMPVIDEFRALAKKVVPFPVEIKTCSWISRFFVQCRSATHYQEDGIFLIGDAAHIHSPAGAQGMNTGLQDAFNLAWKLAMTLKGLAKPEVLKSYHDERKPVGDFLVDRTDRLFKFMVKSSIWARFLRWFVLPRIAQSEKAKRKIARLISQTGIRYDSGILCNDGEHLTNMGLELGVRAPNLSLMSSVLKKTDLHTLITDLHFSWVFFLPENVGKKQVLDAVHLRERFEKRWPKTCKVFLVFARDFEAEKAVMEADYYVSINPSPSFIFEEASYIITRPDHHVFCLGLLSEIDHAEKSLQRFLMESV